MLAAAGEVRTLNVVLDDVLHVVPLDALPLGDGVVGQRLTLRNEVTLARLLRPARAVSSEGGLLVAGGIDYDAELVAEALGRVDGSTPPLVLDLGRNSFLLRAPGHAEALEFLVGGAEKETFAAMYLAVPCQAMLDDRGERRICGLPRGRYIALTRAEPSLSATFEIGPEGAPEVVDLR